MIKLEISGRRTGKTTRIVRMARYCQKRGLKFCIVGITKSIYPGDLQKLVYTHIDFIDDKESTNIILIDEFETGLRGIRILQRNTSKWYVVGTPHYHSTIANTLLKIEPIYCTYKYPELQKDLHIGIFGDNNVETYKSEVLGEFKYDN